MASRREFNIVAVLSSNVSRFNTGINSANNSLTGFQSTLKGVGKAIAAFAAASAVVNIGTELVDLAAKAEGVRKAFANLDDPNLLGDLREATKGTVDDISLMKASIQASNFKIPLDQLATYFQFAQKRARETGESVDYLVQSIITGLGRQSVMILDNLGLSAAEIKNTMKETGDMASAVGKIIARDLSGGDGIDVAIDSMDRFKASLTNTKVALGDMLLPVVASVSDALNRMFPVNLLKAEEDEVKILVVLAERLKSVNITAAERNKIYEDMAALHPSIVHGLNEESEATTKLIGRVSLFLKEKEKQVGLARTEMELERLLSKRAENRLKIEQEGLDARVALGRVIKESTDVESVEAAKRLLKALRAGAEVNKRDLNILQRRRESFSVALGQQKAMLHEARQLVLNYQGLSELQDVFIDKNETTIKTLQDEISHYERELEVVTAITDNIREGAKQHERHLAAIKSREEAYRKFYLATGTLIPKTLEEYDELIRSEKERLSTMMLGTREYDKQLQRIKDLEAAAKVARDPVAEADRLKMLDAKELSKQIKDQEAELDQMLSESLAETLSTEIDVDVNLDMEDAKLNLESFQEGMQEWLSEWGGFISGIESSISSVLGSIESRMLNAKKKDLEAAGNSAKKREEIERNYFYKQKKLRIAEANMSIASAILQSLASAPAPYSFILAGLAGAAGAVQLAAIQSEEFANGGIVYGETLATVGEYAGARNNPEVIAPLNKLKNILREDGMGGNAGDVHFEIAHSTIVGSVDKHARTKNSFK
jgi:hypothetical protein